MACDGPQAKATYNGLQLEGCAKRREARAPVRFFIEKEGVLFLQRVKGNALDKAKALAGPVLDRFLRI